MIEHLRGIGREIGNASLEASVYILFGIFVAGLLQACFDKEKIVRYLGKRGTKSVFLAALFGVPLPLCSCGVLPTAISLRKNGASKGSVISFLISTPESGVDSISLSYAMLDPLMAVFRPFAAFVTAVLAGLTENFFGDRAGEEPPPAEKPERGCCRLERKAASPGWRQKAAAGMRYAFVDLLGDIAKWLVLGIVIGGVISYVVPVSFIENYLGGGWTAMFAMLLVGIPLYICASASTPIAAALIAKGMSPGVALVFLLAGPATNTAGILAVGKFLGKRSAVLYLAAISVCSLGAGFLLDAIYRGAGIDIRTQLGHACDGVPAAVKAAALFILIVLMLNAFFRGRSKKTCDR